jgi:hypothetical protein
VVFPSFLSLTAVGVFRYAFNMKKLLALLAVLTFGLFVAVATTSDTYIISVAEEPEFYNDVYTLYSLMGLASPSYSQPWSTSEAEIILERVKDAENEDGLAKSLYLSLKEKLESLTPPQSSALDGFSYKVGLKLAPEIYLHNNTTDYVIDTDWYYNYDKREKLLTLKLEFGVKNFFYTYSELNFAKSRYTRKGTVIYDHETDFPYGIGAIVPSWETVKQTYMKENGITDEADLPEGWTEEYRYIAHVVKSSEAYSLAYNDNTPFWDFWNLAANFPLRAFVSFGGENWNFLFGRDRVNWGRSIIGNFIIDDHVSYHDTAKLSIYTNSFKYEWTNLFLETEPYVSEVDKKGPDDIKIFMNHRLEFRPASWFSFVLAESIMYRSNVLEIQHLNPGYIYHQLNNRDLFNSIASLELYFTPLKGWDIYYQLGLDNATIPGEGNSQSDAMGMLLGTSYTYAFSSSYIKATVEGAFTTPMMYRRDGVDFLMLQRDYTFIYLGSGTIKLNYIGFPYGSDATVGKLLVEYNIPSVLYSAFSTQLVRKGEINMFHSHNVDNNNNEKANIMGTTPWGETISYELTVAVEAKYYLPEFVNWLDASVFANLAYISKWTTAKSTGVSSEAKTDLQFAFGFSLEV